MTVIRNGLCICNNNLFQMCTLMCRNNYDLYRFVLYPSIFRDSVYVRDAQYNAGFKKTPIIL